MTPRDAWLPVPLRWRHVLAGDVFVARNGTLWHVISTGTAPTGQFLVATSRGPEEYGSTVDPDDSIQVLVPVAERDALRLTRDELGAALVERRMRT